VQKSLVFAWCNASNINDDMHHLFFFVLFFLVNNYILFFLCLHCDFLMKTLFFLQLFSRKLPYMFFLTLLCLYQDYFEKTVFLVFSSQFSVYFTLMLMQSSFVFMRSFDRNNGLVRTLIHHPYYISPSTAFVFGPEVSLCQRCVRRAKITSLCAA